MLLYLRAGRHAKLPCSCLVGLRLLPSADNFPLTALSNSCALGSDGALSFSASFSSFANAAAGGSTSPATITAATSRPAACNTQNTSHPVASLRSGETSSWLLATAHSGAHRGISTSVGSCQDLYSSTNSTSSSSPALTVVRPQTNTAQGSANTGSSSSSSTPAASWRDATRPVFSIRPSYLSPLFTTYQRGQEMEERRQLLMNLLEAHNVLSQEVDGYDKVQVQRGARYRVAQMRELAADLRRLLAAGVAPRNMAECTSPDSMHGFYELLTRGAGTGDADAASFAQVSDGGVDPFIHWRDHFVRKYAGSPGLEPLADVFRKPDPLAELQKLQPPPASDGKAKRKPVHGQYIDAEGLAHAHGKRKKAAARVALRAGTGRMLINGLPLDAYFSDVHVRADVLKPFFVSGLTAARFDVEASVEGGGFSGQAGAIAHGIARALSAAVPRAQRVLRHMCVWDGRHVERKKPGRKKARKGFTWVKR